MKKSRLLALLVLFVLLMTSGCSIKQNHSDEQAHSYQANLYFVQEDTNKLVVEQRKLSYKTEEELPYFAVEELIKGPSAAGMKRVLSKDITLLGCSWNDERTVIVNFSAEYRNMSSTDELLARYSIVQTLCELPGVGDVILLVDGKNLVGSDGQQLGRLSKENIVLDPESTQKKTQTLKLYFSDSQGEALVAEERSVVTNDSDSLEKIIVNELIKGPQNQNLTRTIPVGTKLLSVEVKDGTCFVNFSQDFISKHSGGSTGEMMTVYSIVNSLTEIREVKKVMFLIEGQKVDVFISMIFNEPFERDDSLIQ